MDSGGCRPWWLGDPRRWAGGALLRAAVVAGTALLQLAGAPAALAEEAAITLGDGAFGSREGDAAGLLARAAEFGVLPVIVGLDAPFVPQGQLTAAQAAGQEQVIAGLQEQLLERLASARDVKRFETVPYLALTATAADLRRLLADPAVTSITEDVAAAPTLHRSNKMVGANRAWQRGFRGNGWAVAVIDTGVQLDHPALQGKIVSEACYSSATEGLSTSLCPGGGSSSVEAGSGANCPIGVRGCDHGTHVAGIAVGEHRNRSGIARGASLISIQIFSRYHHEDYCRPFPTPCLLTRTSDQMRAMERVLLLSRSHKIAAVNMSLSSWSSSSSGNCDFDPRKALIDNLRSRGIATVIASGNNGFRNALRAPACISSAITVGSTTVNNDRVSNFSNMSHIVDLLAPGEEISAPVLRNRFGVKSGSSVAAPHVAGAWALLRQAKPEASVQEIARALICTGEAITRYQITKPVINVDAAIIHLRRDANNRERSWDFTTATQFRQWRKDRGDWHHVGQVMRAVGPEDSWYPQWSIATSPLCTDDVVVDVRLRRIDPDTNRHWDSGVLLHTMAPEAWSVSGQQISGLWFAFNKQSGGYASISRMLGGSSRTLCSRPFGTLEIGGFNRLQIISRHGVHRMLINGKQVCKATDRSFEAGYLSIAMETPNTGARRHRLDVRKVVASPQAAGPSLELATPTDLPTAPLEIPAGVSPLGVAVGAEARAVPTR